MVVWASPAYKEIFEMRHKLTPRSLEMPDKPLDTLKHGDAGAVVSRTRHRHDNGSPRFTNRLCRETSPYLLQHAHNPVNWFPWGQEALSESGRMNRPLFVSIGYATCHWCHVMEEESFEDLEIAEFINEHFIPVKVDREERPDIDAIYMAAVQLISGSGGWPLNVFLTPSAKPFYGGTYFPPRDGDRGRFSGFLTILKKIAEVYENKPETAEQTGEDLSQSIRRMLVPDPGDEIPGPDILAKATGLFKQVYDPVNGGMKGAPKFPSNMNPRFLLRMYRKTGDHECLDMAMKTLDRMADGGIYDQVGGGFHRYSTDALWLVPHFEKMLYDNALLCQAYLEAYQISGKDKFRKISEEILTFALRDMRSPEGGFFSASDADSLNFSGEKEEGFFFTWTPEELEKVLGKNRAALAGIYYSVEREPHFEGRHILHIRKDPLDVAKLSGLSLSELQQQIRMIKDILLQERSRRGKPLIDTKIITSWNGLMISAFARTGFALKNTLYIETAVDTAKRLLHHVFSQNKLFRCYTDRQAKHQGYLEDYAFVEQAFLDLYDSTNDPVWLKNAVMLDKILEDYFEDKEKGGFFMTASDHEPLIAREKPGHDNVIPSGNSVAALNLLRLSRLTDQPECLRRAEKTFLAFSTLIEQNPVAFGDMLLALDYYHDMLR